MNYPPTYLGATIESDLIYLFYNPSTLEFLTLKFLLRHLDTIKSVSSLHFLTPSTLEA